MTFEAMWAVRGDKFFHHIYDSYIENFRRSGPRGTFIFSQVLWRWASVSESEKRKGAWVGVPYRAGPTLHFSSQSMPNSSWQTGSPIFPTGGFEPPITPTGVGNTTTVRAPPSGLLNRWTSKEIKLLKSGVVQMHFLVDNKESAAAWHGVQFQQIPWDKDHPSK
jgi:hypothetical protein